MNLDGQSWGFQYSPYAYYNEHCIILSEEHRPMQINEATFERLYVSLSIAALFCRFECGFTNCGWFDFNT